ncbi:hypothetical protein [Teredinibacter turnerae]|uniref:hypothetical protein n=1 Tax=Teredinibacter turnerae TaxID=2426 RepID=UPI00036E95E1|nr:hypothetical protein [Teredinibacter turnerae]
MPLIYKHQTNDSINLEEFVQIAKAHNVSNTEELCELSLAFTKLANNRIFLSNYFESFIKNNISLDVLNSVISQSLVLARTKDFYIRANFWLPREQMTESEVLLFAYDQPHDHNFDLLSVSYCGDGYITEGWIYDYEKVYGYIGELVDAIPLGKHKNVNGEVILYECNKDIHCQRPPETLSITINLIPLENQHGLKDQYFFDIDKVNSTQIIVSKFANTNIQNRINLFSLAQHMVTPEISQIMSDISLKHACRRTREQALKILEKSNPEEHLRLCQVLVNDKSSLVKKYCRSIISDTL